MKGKTLMGLNENLPFLVIDHRSRWSFQNTACVNTQDIGQCPEYATFTVNATIQKFYAWIKTQS
jgi:hypothetical protein